MRKTIVITALGLVLSLPGLDAGASSQHALSASAPAPGTIVTFAGGGVGDGRVATRAYLEEPVGIATDAAGILYTADWAERRVRMVRGGIMTTLAGTGDFGYSGDGGPAIAARFEYLQGIAADKAGDVFVSDLVNSHDTTSGVIRRIDTRGVITTLASGLQQAEGMAVSPDGGTLYVAETNGSRVIAVATASGATTTIAGLGPAGAPAVVYGYTGDTLPAAQSPLALPRDVALDPPGKNLYIADTGNGVVRKVTLSTGAIATVLGVRTTPYTGNQSMPVSVDTSVSPPQGSEVVAVAVDSQGHVYVADGSRGTLIITSPGSPGAAMVVSKSTGPLAISPHGDVYAVGACGHPDAHLQGFSACIINVRGGEVVAGEGGRDPLYDAVADGERATNTFIAGARRGSEIVSDSTGEIYFTDAAQVIRVDGHGAAWGIAGSGSWPPPSQTGTDGRDEFIDNPAAVPARTLDLEPAGVAPDGRGNIYISDYFTSRVVRVDPQGVVHDVTGPRDHGFLEGGPSTSSFVHDPEALLAAPDGTLYIADGEGGVVLHVDRRGIITTVAGGGSCPLINLSPTSPPRNGEPATQACLAGPSSLAMDASGNLYIAETGNGVVDKVTPGGAITLVAGGGSGCTLFFNGDGGLATQACLSVPQGVAADAAGTLFIADTGNGVVRKVDTHGVITTVVGSEPLAAAEHLLVNEGNLYPEINGGAPPDRGDDGPASGAYLQWPTGIAVDAHGNLYIYDALDGRIREVAGIATAGAHTAGTLAESSSHRERHNHPL